jgi:hypothetical protein
MRGKKRARGKGLQTRRGANENVSSVKATNSDVSGVELLELFREGYVDDAWFQSEDNLDGLKYSNEVGLWYLDNRVVVPAGEARERVVEEAHDSPYRGQFGKHKVLHQINQTFGGLQLEEGCENYVFDCLVCQRNKAQTVKKAGLLQPLSIPSF